MLPSSCLKTSTKQNYQIHPGLDRFLPLRRRQLRAGGRGSGKYRGRVLHSHVAPRHGERVRE